MPQHKRQQQVDEVTHMKGKYKSPVYGRFKKQHVEGKYNPKRGRYQALYQANTLLAKLIWLLPAQPDPKDGAGYSKQDPDQMLQTVIDK